MNLSIFFYPYPVFLYVWMPLIGEFMSTFGNTKLSFLSSMACSVLVGTCQSHVSHLAPEHNGSGLVKSDCCASVTLVADATFLFSVHLHIWLLGTLIRWVAQTLPRTVLGPSSWCTDVISTFMRKFTLASPSQPKCLLTYLFASVLEGEEFFIFSIVRFPVPPPSRPCPFNWSPSLSTTSDLAASISSVHKGSDLTHSKKKKKTLYLVFDSCGSSGLQPIPVPPLRCSHI